MTSEISLVDYTALVHLTGGLAGTFCLNFGSPLAMAIAKAFFVEDEPGIEDHLDEIIIEVTNIIIGNALSEIQNYKTDVSIETPIAITSSSLVMRYFGTQMRSCMVDTDYGSLRVSFLTSSIAEIESAEIEHVSAEEVGQLQEAG